MKKRFTYVILLASALFLCSCQEPAPTELIDEEPEAIEIQAISADSEHNVYENGFDSTRYISENSRFSSLIRLSLVRTTFLKPGKHDSVMTTGSAVAEAVFYDTLKKVFLPGTGRFAGYRTKYLGKVYFGNDTASLSPFAMRFRDKGTVKNIGLGPYYVLRKGDHPGSPAFPYNSEITFKVKSVFDAEQVSIPTPSKIEGSVAVKGKKNSGLSFELSWNALNKGKIEIIVGGSRSGKKEVFPYFSIKTADSGRLKVPEKLLKGFPFDKYQRITFSFIRKNEYQQTTRLMKDINIAVQSVHIVQSEIP